MLDLPDELLRADVVQQLQPAPFDPDLQVAGGEGADEDDPLGRLRDVDETAGAGQPRPELADVEIALAIGLGQAQEGEVETTAIVEVELVRLVDDRLRIDGRAEVEARGRNAADDAGLGRQREQVDDLLFGRDAGDALGHADAEIDDAVGLQLERRAARNDLALAHRHRRQ